MTLPSQEDELAHMEIYCYECKDYIGGHWQAFKHIFTHIPWSNR